MTRFNKVTYSSASSTAEIGAGLIWDDVYAQLEPFGVSVVGGRVSGVGVAGFTLGGGEATFAYCVLDLKREQKLWDTDSDFVLLF